MPKQLTLKKSIHTTGIGVHSGETAQITLHPAPMNTGIIFRRIDLPIPVEIPAKAAFIGDTDFCTCLVKDGVRVATIEHLLSAFSGMQIDNCYVDLTLPELPIMDGSASPFVALIASAGILEQDAPKKFIRIKKSIEVRSGDKFARLDPFDGFRVSFEIAFDHPVIAKTKQALTLDVSQTVYVEEIARARTFGFLQDYEMMRNKKLAMGASLENTVVLDVDSIVNKKDLRYPDEFVKHKILDAIGDLYLLGHNLIGAFTGFKSGHALNGLLVKQLLLQPDVWEFTLCN